MDISYLDKLEKNKYPEIRFLIERIQTWDRKADINSLGAGSFAVLYDQLRPYYRKLPEPKIFPASFIIEALRKTKKYLLKYFNTTEVTLGDYQKLVRGANEIPIFGLPDVITAMSSRPYKDGKVSGWQVEVAPPGNDTGGVYESYGRGWLIKPEKEKDSALKMGEWNTMRIRVVGDQIESWLNGTSMIILKDEKIGKGQGSIALQIHDGGGIKVRWKNLFVTAL